MNETEQIPFHKKRRQHFLTEEKWKYEIGMRASNLQFWIDKWQEKQTDLKYLIYLKVNDDWRFLRLNYTAGEPISNLSSILDDIIHILETSTQFWKEHKKELAEHGYYTGPFVWNDSDNYMKVIGLISVCYLLQREDLLPRLLDVILANAEDGLEPDTTIEDFFYYRFKDRPDTGYVQMGDHAILISDAIRGETKEEQLEELNAYLKDWYHEMVGMSDLEYQSHLDPEQNGFCGYWAFEAAAIVYLDDLDDTELRQYPYYPKDMVDWAREQKLKREQEQDGSDNLPLLLNAGTPAPFTGRYGINNFIGHEIQINQGELLPAGQVSAKRDKNGNPIFREDTVWRLLKREDKGKVRFSEKELEELQK